MVKLSREGVGFGFIVVILTLFCYRNGPATVSRSEAVQVSVLDSGASISRSTLSNTSPLA